MDFTITTPTTLFGMVSLLMLAYTNRFLGLAKLIRDLHGQWLKTHHAPIQAQIGNLRLRIRFIRAMQFLGAMSILIALLSMACVYFDRIDWAKPLFGLSVCVVLCSTALSMCEIALSTNALEIELADMEKAPPAPKA